MLSGLFLPWDVGYSTATLYSISVKQSPVKIGRTCPEKVSKKPPFFRGELLVRESATVTTQDASHHQDHYIFDRGSRTKPTLSTVTGWGVDPNISSFYHKNLRVPPPMLPRPRK